MRTYICRVITLYSGPLDSMCTYTHTTLFNTLHMIHTCTQHYLLVLWRSRIVILDQKLLRIVSNDTSIVLDTETVDGDDTPSTRLADTRDHLDTSIGSVYGEEIANEAFMGRRWTFARGVL